MIDLNGKKVLCFYFVYEESVMNIIRVAAALVLAVAVSGVSVTGFTLGTVLIICCAVWALILTGSFSQFGIH